MLYLTRKPGEAVVINDQITLTVVEVKGKAVKLGFVSPPGTAILRKELHDRIREENLAASQSMPDMESLAALEGTGWPAPQDAAPKGKP